jgi:hypothetical protein
VCEFWSVSHSSADSADHSSSEAGRGILTSEIGIEVGISSSI